MVPTLMSQTKWYKSDRDSKVGDVVLFLKSEKEFNKQYQYGIVTEVKVSRDDTILELDDWNIKTTMRIKRHT